MATNYIQEGDVLDWTNAGSAVSSGDPVQVGLRGMGIALVDIATGATGSVGLEGVYALPLNATDTLTVGAPVWWDASAAEVVNTPILGDYFLGWSCDARSAAANQVVRVQLAPFSAEGQRQVTLAATGNQALSADALLAGQANVLVPNTGALTLTLPALASVPPGAALTVTKSTAAGGGTAVTLDGAGAETVDGQATLATIDAQWDTLTLAALSSGWVIVFSKLA